MNSYGLPENYIARLEPKYFDDILDSSEYWQADVYRLMVQLAREHGIKKLIDIGCGHGKKLIPYANEFEIIGVDYQRNIEYCRSNYNWGTWISCDLSNEILDIDFSNSICCSADVIEHLIRPEFLIETLHYACETAAYVLVSTPDRERLYDGEQNGPPDNPAHVREWTLDELEEWFVSEILPVRWAGWTVSYDRQPDRVNTSLIVLSKDKTPNMPITFQPAEHWRKPVINQLDPKLIKVWMTPTPNEAGRDVTNAINQIVVRVDKYLPEFGVQLVEQPDQAVVHAGHAGQGSQAPIHVAHYHGLYPTAQGSDNFAVNAAVIRNLKTALIHTAPSQWIADVLRRDMHIEPRVIGWGVDVEEWKPLEPHQPPYVIWNKARVDNVSNPQPMLELAARAHDILFLTTFGQGTPNVMTIGRQPYEVMKQHVRHASVYLSTNVETFGIGLMEAMAAGVPVLSFRQGAQADYIQHGINGFLAEPGDMEGLYKGLLYCLEHKKRLGQNARETAKRYTWRRVAEQFAAIYHEVVEMQKDVRPHRIDESLYKVS